MSEWSEGYVTDIGYTYGYYPELNPARARWALLSQGWAAPDVHDACELGFGQGLSINLHAAGSGVRWHGTDFNPSQVAFARSLAGVSGADVSLLDDAFETFCARSDLPDFDFIGLHGIWSWISDHNRQVIADFLRRKLRVGGVAFISYNTLPGWSTFAPMRHLMLQHAQAMNAPGQSVPQRVDSALSFAQRVLDTEPQFVKALPKVAERLKKIQKQNRSYLAHEYFNRDWAPMYFADMAASLGETKLSFACSAHFLDHVDPLNLTDKQRALLKDIPDPIYRETVRDFMVNQQFRRDYWVKGPIRLSAAERRRRLQALAVVLVAHRPDVSLKVSGALGEADMNKSVYEPLLDMLAASSGPLTIAALEAGLVGAARMKFEQIIQAVSVLLSAGHVQLVNDMAPPTDRVERAQRLNRQLCSMAADGGEISFLSSPVTGGGVHASRFDQLFLGALYAGASTPQDWATSAWRALEERGERLLVDGKTLESAADNLAELVRRAETFAGKRLHGLRSVGVVP